MISESINLLGLKATDKITSLEGVITVVCFDLYGCVQVILQPKVLTDKQEIPDGRYIDVARLSISSERVMDTPDFDHITIESEKEVIPETYPKGPAEKPAYNR